jgi:hypothetical protein
MNRENDTSGKSLKGYTTASAGTVDESGTTTTTASKTFTTVDLENVFIFSGSADDLTIGAIVPAAGAFSELTVGKEGGPSGKATFWGNSTTDFAQWDPLTSDFYIGGNLIVRDETDLGNIRIWGNTIQAIRPIPTGDINLFPQAQGQVGLAGSFAQTSPGFFQVNQATNFSVQSTSTAYIHGGTQSQLTTRNGNIVIANDYSATGWTFTIFSITPTPNVSSPNLVLVRTTLDHPFQVGDIVKFASTNNTQLDNTANEFLITASADLRTFTINTQTLLTNTITGLGTVFKKRIGSITLDSGSIVHVTPNAPLSWGPRARITGTQLNELNVNSDFLVIDDPIPSLRVPGGLFSDAGISLSYRDAGGTNRTGFFGFENSTEHFTWIPNATITRNVNGTKTVSGTRGIMRLEGLVINKMSGDPDLLLEATRNIILSPGVSIRTTVNKPIVLGNSTLTPFANGNLQLATAGNFQISPTVAGRGIMLENGSPVFFNSAQTQQIVGSNTGLTVSSSSVINLQTPSGGNINIPQQVYLTFGNSFQRIYGDNLGLNLESIGDISLVPAQPNGVVRLPINARLVFGDRNNFIVGGGTGQGLNINANGPTTMTSTSTIALNPTNGLLQTSATITNFPATSSLTFGGAGTSGLSVTPNSMTMSSTGSGGNVTLAAQSAINLTGQIINVPLNTPLTFGQRATIIQTDTEFNMVSPNNTNVTTPRFTINGDLQVVGNVTYITTTTSAFKDPILAISMNPPSGDPTHKGIEFEWWDGITKKLGAMYFNTQEKRFYLGKEVTNNNEILTSDVLGDLVVGNVSSGSISTGSFMTNSITGTPDLNLIANGGSVFITPSTSIVIPLGVPINSGQNSIVSSATNGWTLTAPRVSIPNGTLALGPSVFTMASTNNLRIGGIPRVSIDATLELQSNLTFGTGQTRINIDASENLVLTSLSNIVLTSNAMMNGGMTMGNAFMSYTSDVPGGRVVWRNTNPTTDLYLSIQGAIYDAHWRGQPIGLDYGGTGHEGPWTLGSVVFVDSSNNKTFLAENPDQFFWDSSALSLGLRTSAPVHTLTIGQGNIDLMDAVANVFFRHSGQYAWSMGKSASHNVFSIRSSALPTSNVNFLSPVLSIAPTGSIGINQTELFMSSSANTSTARLYIAGNQRFTQSTNRLGWSDSEYITSNETRDLSLNASGQIVFQAPSFHHFEARFSDVNNKIYGAPNNKLHLSTLNGTYFNSPHNVFVGRCCFYHDPLTDACLTFASVASNGNLQLRNDGGDIIIKPVNSVTLPSTTRLVFGDAQEGILQAIDGELRVTGTRLQLSPSTSVNIGDGVPVVFNNTTSLVQNSNGFNVTTTTPINLNTSAQIVVPDNVKLAFGTVTSPRYIMSDTNNLIIASGDDVQIRANLTTITGDLIVEGYTSQRFFTETSMESGILQIGGSSITKITNLEQWSTTTSTRVTTNAPHYLKVGDKITIVNSDPDIDAEYTVAEVPTANTFVIPLVVPSFPPSDPPTGDVRSVLVNNPNKDVGIQVNWHTGLPIAGTDGSRTGFFGVLRTSTNRFTYLSQGTNINGIFTGTLGDAQFNTVFANFLSAGALSSPLNTQGFAVSGTNFQINGGAINNTPIGSTTPSTGIFTNLRVTQNLIMESNAVISNMNADMVDGKHALDFVWRDGTQSLTGNWNAGPYRITSATMASTALNPTSVVFAGTGGLLTSSSLFTFNNNVLTVPSIGAFSLVGTLDATGQNITNAVVVNSTINNSDITLQASNTIDARLGTVLLRNGQLSGNVISGGTAQTNISGNAATVTNGVYSTLFGPHTIIKADTANTPVPLTVPEARLVGRLVGGTIAALTAAETRAMINVAERGSENIYEGGALMRQGNTTTNPDGGTMTGLLFRSSEYIEMQSDQLATLSPSKNFSYVSVNASAGSTVATVVIPNGVGLAQEKYIILADVPSGTVVRIMGDIISYGATSYISLWSNASNTSAHLVWNSVKGCWNVLTGLIADTNNPFT